MIDANQVWDVPEAIDWINKLAEFRPLWIEEPTSPDDVLGHATIRRAVAPIGVATGEHGMNRVLFMQLFPAESTDFCQLDSPRLASIKRDHFGAPDGTQVRRSPSARMRAASGSANWCSIFRYSTTSPCPVRSTVG